jgi:hypothetical protein
MIGKGGPLQVKYAISSEKRFDKFADHLESKGNVQRVLSFFRRSF